MNKMKNNIKLVAVDIDGTFVRSDYSYDVERFKRIWKKMKEVGCHFVVASGNQYYQLRDLFPGLDSEFAFVAENGAFVKDEDELLFHASMDKEVVHQVIDECRKYPEILNVLCGLESAYCQKGTVSQEFFDLTSIYYHHLKWVDDFKDVDDEILKFAPTVPKEKTYEYYDLFKEKFAGKVEPTTSGHGSIDLIVPGCHKASGLRLVERWKITPEQCMSFGDGGNDVEMLKYCKYSYAMENGSAEAKQAAKVICPSNNDDGVLEVLEKVFC